MADKNTADIGFEKQIWDAACVLRGNMDASEYKNVVLGLIFLKYISDRFDDKYKELVDEGDGFEEDVDEYTSEGIFFVPAGARWREIAGKAHTSEIGIVIDDAMRAIEKKNKRLKDILPKNFARSNNKMFRSFASLNTLSLNEIQLNSLFLKYSGFIFFPP